MAGILKKKLVVCLALVPVLSGCSVLSTIEEKVFPTPTPVPVYSDMGNAFYYEQLGETQKTIYDRIEYACENYETEVDLGGAYPVTDVFAAQAAFFREHPEAFWTKQYSWTGEAGSEEASSLSFREIEDLPVQVAKIRDVVQAVVDGRPGGSTYDTVKYFYEWIINNTEYSSDSPYNQDVRSVFLDHKSVCSGYAMAFAYLCHEAGIPCVYVEGYANGENHAWNLVWIDNVPYWVDVTWGEEKTYGSGEEGINYNFLCVDDSVMNVSHIYTSGVEYSNREGLSDVFAYPACTDSSLDYYNRENCRFETYDRGEMYAFFLSKFSDNVYDISFRMGSEEEYRKAYEDLFSETDPYIRSILKQWFTGSIRYSYSGSENAMVIRVKIQ